MIIGNRIVSQSIIRLNPQILVKEVSEEVKNSSNYSFIKQNLKPLKKVVIRCHCHEQYEQLKFRYPAKFTLYLIFYAILNIVNLF